MKDKTSLILEGGGMRGLYTAGILDYFLEMGLEFNSVYGVSAGCLNGVNFISKQKGRNLATFTDYLDDKNYRGLRIFLKTGNFFNPKFIYDDIPNKLNLFDYDAFALNPTNFYVVVSNIKTGQAEYIKCDDIDGRMDYIRASASLPLISQVVKIDNDEYLDGGICDSIPLQKSILDGNEKNVVILTQHRGFVKKPTKNLGIFKSLYNKKYPKLYEAIKNRHRMYNRELKYLYNAEENGSVFIIQPDNALNVSRLEKDKYKLYNLYNIGYLQAKEMYPKIIEYLNS